MSTNRRAEEILDEFNEKVEVLRLELVEELKAAGAEKWEPQGGDWYIDGSGNTVNYSSALGTRNFGVERKTEEAANKAAEQMRRHNRLLAYADEHNGGWEPDWSDPDQCKCSIGYCHVKDTWVLEERWRIEDVGVYMPYSVAKNLLEKLRKDEVAL